MRDAAGQLPDRLHLLRLHQCRAGLFQRLLGMLLFGHVAGNLGEAEQLAFGIEDAIDHDTGPEAAAVLAHAPAFALVASLFGGDRQCPRRGAGRAVLLRIELREMPADDLVGGVALDTLAAEVPIRDVALRVDHVDRVIDDPLHQHAKRLLAFGERRLALLLLGRVADRGGEPLDGALRPPHRLDDQQCLKPAAVLEGEPAGPAEPVVPLGDAQCRFDPARRRPGREQTIECHPAQLLPRITAGRLGHAGPAGDDAMPVEQEEAGEDRHVGLVLVGRFGSGRHRSTAIKRRARRNRSMWRAARCINRR